MSIKFDLKGAKEAEEALKSLSNKDKIQVYYKLNRKGANIIKKKLVAKAPSQKIKKAVKIKRDKTDKTKVIIGFLKKVFYVRFLEFGTEIRKTRKRKANKGKMNDSKQFIRKAHDEGVNELQKKIGDNYQQELNKILKSEIRRINRKLAKYKK
jgi:HK97 gp10 family phage protein